MSKSLGNLVFVDDLVPRFPADVIRLYLLSHQYREPFEWSEDGIVAATERHRRLVSAAAEPDSDGGARDAFRAALEDDMNTRTAIETLFDARGATLRKLAGVLGLRL
jgi:cysteinyl-tRNA synthetase